MRRIAASHLYRLNPVRHHGKLIIFNRRVWTTFPNPAVSPHRQFSTPTSISASPFSTSEYELSYQRSISDPSSFWCEQAESVVWMKKSAPVLQYHSSQPHDYSWFPHYTLNTCFNCVDHQIAQGRGEQTAVIYDSPVTNTIQHITYNQLLEQVSMLADALHCLGIRKGDRVLLYLPMIPEAVYSMLACSRIGAVHSVVFGGFAAPELAKRIIDCQPKLIITASCGIEPTRIVQYKPLVDEAIKISQKANTEVPNVIVVQRSQCTATLIQPRDLEYKQFIQNRGTESVGCVEMKATDPLYILYTSGTTGTPKGVLRDNGGHAVALKYAFRHVFGIQPGEVWWAASDIGWVVGHSFIIYAPLLSGSTTVLYEGKPVGTPDAGAFWRVIKQHSVVSIFAAPTALRAIKKEDHQGKFITHYRLQQSAFRAFFLAGERGDPDTIVWAQRLLGVPVIDNYWQTETGWPIISNAIHNNQTRYPVKPGSPTKPLNGYSLSVVNDEGHVIRTPNHEGNLVIQLPLPPGCFLTLYQNPHRHYESYLKRFPGYFDTSDSGYIDEDGYCYVMSRTDDVMNVAGHRLSSGQLEEVLAIHSAVAEVAVVGKKDLMKGQIPVGFVVLKSFSSSSFSPPVTELESELIAAVRTGVGPVASFHTVCVVSRLPKTRSGKILRNVLRALLDGEEVKIPPTIEDPAVIEEIRDTIMKKSKISKK